MPPARPASVHTHELQTFALGGKKKLTIEPLTRRWSMPPSLSNYFPVDWPRDGTTIDQRVIMFIQERPRLMDFMIASHSLYDTSLCKHKD